MWAIFITYACLSLDCPESAIDPRRFETFSLCESARRRIDYAPTVFKTECRQVLVDEDE